MKVEGILSPKHLEAGFYLEEEDDHILLLRRGSQTVATFNQDFVSLEMIVTVVDTVLEVEARDERR